MHAILFVAALAAMLIFGGQDTQALATESERQSVLSYVGETSDDKRSFADSGFAVAFQRPADMKSIVAVKICAARYGHPEPPNEDFHVYVLDQDKKVLEQIAIPYRSVARMESEGDFRWYDFKLPALEVPEKFFVALWFNAERTKGVYMGMKKCGQEKHSYIGLPDKGYQEVDTPHEWMIRAVVSSATGQKPTYPKVTTYGEEKAADTESVEALPTRTWNDATGAFSVEAQFLGLEKGKVKLKKADGKTASVPLEQLCDEDREFVAEQVRAKRAAAGSKAAEARELSRDNGVMASKASINGGGHAVKFNVDGDSYYVTSVSLHGSRYGEARPPKENFKVWICDAQFKPIASFGFPYSSYIRGNPTWKSFRIRATRVPRDFIVCFAFNPHQTKGIYASYDDKPSDTSMVGIPGAEEPKPFAKGNWLIRCKVEQREEK
jgi:RNA polymerase sigma-70 factor (ECF subfamily)